MPAWRSVSLAARIALGRRGDVGGQLVRRCGLAGMMPTMPAGSRPLKIAQSSAWAIFSAASTTGASSGSGAPRATESSSMIGSRIGTRSSISGCARRMPM